MGRICSAPINIMMMEYLVNTRAGTGKTYGVVPVVPTYRFGLKMHDCLLFSHSPVACSK